MSFKCKIGFHSWEGCTCKICGKVRDNQHDLSRDCEECSKCGKKLENQHNWSEDCDKCSACGKVRENKHSWLKDCEKCSKCGKIRSGYHQVVNGICQICGHGTYIDESDGKKYKIVKIGDQILMAENYAKRPKSGISWAYDDTETNVDKYGLLYDWETARNTAPKGWHLPTKDEWEKLHLFLGGDDKKVYEQIKIGGDSGFENTFGGFRTARGAYNSLAASAHFWSATPEGEKLVWYFKVGAYSNNAKLEKGEHNLGLSVRFFRDK
jgi:uncharacterized protein (TIGR02145 family)